MATSTLGNGTLVLAGTTSGTTTVTATAVAGTTTLTLPAATDTLVGKATTDTLTNKTLTTPSVSSPTISDGTANGVAYLNGSKVLTTGSALVFDGTNLGLGVTPNAYQSGARAFQNSAGALYTVNNLQQRLSFNAYRASDGNDKYIATGFATEYRQGEGSGIHSWHIAASGTAGNAITFTQAMTLDASGNLGVGVTAPQNKLQVVTTTRPQFSVSYNGTTGLYLEDATNSSWKSWKLSTSFGAGSDLSFVQSTNTSGTPTWAATAAMTLDASGNLLVGTTSLPLTQGFAAIAYAGGTYARIAHNTSAGTSDGYIQFFYNSTQIGSIAQNGTSAVQYLTSSDYRLKENIVPMTGALAVVLQLNPVTYNWKSDGTVSQGFIAHELQTVVPDCVNGEKDAVDAEGNPVYQGIDTSFLVATLTAAIQELKAEFDAYKASHP